MEMKCGLLGARVGKDCETFAGVYKAWCSVTEVTAPVWQSALGFFEIKCCSIVMVSKLLVLWDGWVVQDGSMDLIQAIGPVWQAWGWGSIQHVLDQALVLHTISWSGPSYSHARLGPIALALAQHTLAWVPLLQPCTLMGSHTQGHVIWPMGFGNLAVGNSGSVNYHYPPTTFLDLGEPCGPDHMAPWARSGPRTRGWALLFYRSMSYSCEKPCTSLALCK